MEPLFDYQDYVDYLGHSSELARQWALSAIQRRFPRRFASQVSQLIGDSNEHLACSAPKYLASHGAIEYTPAILESFIRDHGNVPSNCAIALGDMGYGLAKDTIIERLAHCESANTLYGITYYLGKIRDRDCHDALRNVFGQLTGHYFADLIAQHLLEQGDPEDIPTVLDVYFNQANRDLQKDTFLKRLTDSAGAGGLFGDFTEHSIHDLFEAPRKAFQKVLSWHPMVDPELALIKQVIRWIEKIRFQDVVTALAFDARNILRSRYPKEPCPEHYQTIFEKDRMALAFLEDSSKRSVMFERETKDNSTLRNHLAAAISLYLSIHERGGYLSSLEPDANLEDMIEALKLTGREFPERIQDRLIELSPIEPLQTILSDTLDRWGDIWTVRLMGQIGHDEFIPDLIRVLSRTDGLSFIHQDAVEALQGMEYSSHRKTLSSIEKGELTDPWDIFPLLEHLPYGKSFEIAQRFWDQGAMDSSEVYATCLEGIGDARGIEALQEVFSEGHSVFIGDSLEVLGLLHGRDIPELPIIKRERERSQARRGKRLLELNDLAKRIQERGGIEASLAGQTNALTIRHNAPKIGRNAPCPCGSGKKYKKCCMGKDRLG
jgi:hypothetical protein